MLKSGFYGKWMAVSWWCRNGYDLSVEERLQAVALELTQFVPEYARRKPRNWRFATIFKPMDSIGLPLTRSISFQNRVGTNDGKYFWRVAKSQRCSKYMTHKTRYGEIEQISSTDWQRTLKRGNVMVNLYKLCRGNLELPSEDAQVLRTSLIELFR